MIIITSKNQYFYKNLILLAAHCIHEKRKRVPKTPRDITALLGAYDLNESFETGRYYAGIKKIIIHKDWNPHEADFDADIAILELIDKVQFNSYIQPACLCDPNSEVAQQLDGFVAGYGKSENKSKIHENIPKVLHASFYENEDCFLKNKDLVTLSSKRTFCAGNANGEGVCVGDSGGGYFFISNGTFYLRGIVSSSMFHFGGDCDVDTYAVYTNVFKFLDWMFKIN